MDSSAGRTPRGSGLVSFVAILFMVAAGFNLIVGATSLFNEDYLTGADLPVSNLEVWGVILLLVAAVQGATGLGIMARSAGARTLGIAIAVLAALAHFVYHGASTGWASTLLVVDLVIIYVLAVHGDEFA